MTWLIGWIGLAEIHRLIEKAMAKALKANPEMQEMVAIAANPDEGDPLKQLNSDYSVIERPWYVSYGFRPSSTFEKLKFYIYEVENSLFSSKIKDYVSVCVGRHFVGPINLFLMLPVYVPFYIGLYRRRN